MSATIPSRYCNGLWTGPQSRATFVPADLPMISRLIARMNADSSLAIAVAAIVGRLPLRTRDRKRPHNLICAFHAISRTRRGAAATFACLTPLDTSGRSAGFGIAGERTSITAIGAMLGVEFLVTLEVPIEVAKPVAESLRARDLSSGDERRDCKPPAPGRDPWFVGDRSRFALRAAHPSAVARCGLLVTSRPARRDTHRPAFSRPPPSVLVALQRSSPC